MSPATEWQLAQSKLADIKRRLNEITGEETDIFTNLEIVAKWRPTSEQMVQILPDGTVAPIFGALTKRERFKFGERVEGIHASERNPQKYGIVVRYGRRVHGQMNPGPYYEITDGNGNFWESPAEFVRRDTRVPPDKEPK